MYLFSDLSNLRKLLEQAITMYTASDFSELTALSSRLIARRTHSFRAQYGFKLLRKTTVALSRLHNLNIIELLSNFLGTLPDYQLPTKIALPTKDNFDFILIRLQCLSKLLLRIAVCARESSCAFFKYIHRNFFWETCIMYIGLLSQTWTIAKRLCKHTVEFYGNLRPFRQHFQNNKKHWINDNDSLEIPNTLDDWVGEDLKWELMVKTMKKNFLKSDDMATNMLQLHFSEFLDDDNDNDIQPDDVKPTIIMKENEKITFKNSLIVKREFQHNITTVVPSVGELTDIGQSLNRATMHEELLPNKCNSIDDIQRFMKNEKNLRSIGKHKVSQTLSNTQWTDVENQINNIIVTSQGRVTVKKFKKLWSITINK